MGFITIYLTFYEEVMECLYIFVVIFFAGFIQLIVTVLSKYKVIDSDIEFDETES